MAYKKLERKTIMSRKRQQNKLFNEIMVEIRQAKDIKKYIGGELLKEDISSTKREILKNVLSEILGRESVL